MSASVTTISDYSVYNQPPYLLAEFLGTNLVSILQVADFQFNELETCFMDLLTKTSLVNAVGIQLDIIGLDIGLARNGRSDVDYRVALYVQISLNISCGVSETLYTLLNFLGCLNIQLGFYYPGKLWIMQDSLFTQSDLRKYLSPLVVAGVGLGLQVYVIDNNSNFIIDNNGNNIIATIWE